MTRQLGSYGKYLAHIQAAFQGAFRRGDCCIVKYPEQTFSAIGGHCQPRRTDSGQEVFTGAGNNIAGVPLSQLSHSDQVAEAVAWAAESAGTESLIGNFALSSLVKCILAVWTKTFHRVRLENSRSLTSKARIGRDPRRRNSIAEELSCGIWDSDSEDEDSQDEFKMPRDDEEEEKEEEENEDEDVIMEGAEFTDGRPAVNPVFGDPGLLSFLQLECDKNHAALLFLRAIVEGIEPATFSFRLQQQSYTLGVLVLREMPQVKNRMQSKLPPVQTHVKATSLQRSTEPIVPGVFKVILRQEKHYRIGITTEPFQIRSRELRVYGTNPLNSSIEFAGFKFNDVRLSEGILVNMHAIHQVVIRGNIPQHERDEREAVEQAMNSGHSTAKIERQ
ncbi:hypothetical protein R3P38DRAFT_2792251 [Favolaschia claudopus]|uniref:Uncharacterized protein n=1 Tax=Favolaschia claudopus TaxID=2862362 RepID=A0AAW0AGI1_9AGAR